MSVDQETLETITSALDRLKGNGVIITKDEIDDRDETSMQLESFALENYERPVDDYLSATTLQLAGGGETITDEHSEPLPYSSYDIPLEDIQSFNVTDGQVYLKTSRGEYTISSLQ